MSRKSFCGHCNMPTSERSEVRCDKCNKLLESQVGNRITEHAQSFSIQVERHSNRDHLDWCLDCAAQAGLAG